MSKIKKVIKQILLKTVFKWKLIYAYNQYRKKVDRQYILFGIPEHGNIGDHAIAIAEREFLKDIGIEDVFEVPIQKQSTIIKTIQKKILPNDVILITGGGFIGNQWMTEENMVREVVKTFPNNKTIIFPSTIYYKDDEDGKKELEKSREIYSAHQNLVICAREKKTYDFILKNYPQIKALLAPDIVLYLDRSEKRQERNNEILLCLRADPEKNITDQQTKYIDEISQKYGQVRYIDTVIHRRVNPKDREMVLTEKLNEFSAAKLVITDRLHGMIFAAITGTPCIALGNYNYKIEGVYEWIKGLNYIFFVKDINIVQEKVSELLKLQYIKNNIELKTCYKNLEKELKGGKMVENVKMKRYLDCYIPTETCNLRCHYCYITQDRKFNNKVAKFQYSPEYIRKALAKERLGGICLVNLCAGGETLIAEEVIDVARAILEEGHYVMIVTNGTLTNRFKKIAQFPKELLGRLFFKFSFHYLEFLRLNLMDRFFENINLMRNVGASFTIEITPSDELIEHIDNIKKLCNERLGTLCHITIARVNHGKIAVLTNKEYDEYKKIWGQFDSELFNFKTEIFSKKRKEFCYAGEWSLYVNLVTGEYQQCYYGLKLGNIYENIDKPLKTLPIGNNCRLPHCYNGHSYLSFGCIPELNTPTYNKLRNRIDSNGNEWLSANVNNFMQSKLKESNREYTDKEKKVINLKNKAALPKDFFIRASKRVSRKIKSIRKNKE